MTDEPHTKPDADPACPRKGEPSPAARLPPDSGLISIDRFFETDLRVARVISAEPHPNAERLLVLQVDLGSERRQLVAGLAGSYAPETLVGKQIVVVANLKPARLRGVESQGMLLAADVGGRPIVATFEEAVEPGTRVR